MVEYVRLDDLKTSFAVPDFDRLEYPDEYEHPVVTEHLAFTLCAKGEKVAIHTNKLIKITSEGVQFNTYDKISQNPLAMYIVNATKHIAEEGDNFHYSRIKTVRNYIQENVVFTISSVEVAINKDFIPPRQVAYYRFEELEGIYEANKFHPYIKQEAWKSGILREIDNRLTFQEFSLPGDMLNCYPVADPKPVTMDEGRQLKLSVQRAIAEERRKEALYKDCITSAEVSRQCEENIATLKRILGEREGKRFTPTIIRGIFEEENDGYVLKDIRDPERGLSSPFMSTSYALKAIAEYDKYRSGLTPNRCEKITRETENLVLNREIESLSAKDARKLLANLKELIEETKKQHDALPTSAYWPPVGIHSSSMGENGE